MEGCKIIWGGSHEEEGKMKIGCGRHAEMWTNKQACGQAGRQAGRHGNYFCLSMCSVVTPGQWDKYTVTIATPKRESRNSDKDGVLINDNKDNRNKKMRTRCLDSHRKLTGLIAYSLFSAMEEDIRSTPAWWGCWSELVAVLTEVACCCWCLLRRSTAGGGGVV